MTTTADRTEIEVVYGVAMPVVQYTLTYSCGCEYHPRIASFTTQEGEVVHNEHPCSECYTGPYGNVWD